MKVNHAALVRALERGARVVYFDHHSVSAIPEHPHLEAHIDTAPDVCTSLLVDRHLRGAHRMWAVVAEKATSRGRPSTSKKMGFTRHTSLMCP